MMTLLGSNLTLSSLDSSRRDDRHHASERARVGFTVRAVADHERSNGSPQPLPAACESRASVNESHEPQAARVLLPVSLWWVTSFVLAAAFAALAAIVSSRGVLSAAELWSASAAAPAFR